MYFQCQKLPRDTHLVLSHDIEILLGKLQCLGQATNYALAGYAVLENKRKGHSQLEDCCARPPESFYGVHTSTFAQWTTQRYVYQLALLGFPPHISCPKYHRCASTWKTSSNEMCSAININHDPDLGKVASHITDHPKSSEILRTPSFLKSYMAAWVVANDAVPKASTLHNHGPWKWTNGSYCNWT